ncbi:MAG: HAD family hydrolase [Actinobacteria bacterium]|nr:HAD family hydrolase [Actinomycetota bacterium]MBI3686372.1 HAD family hydrolase [Actinomycetota bacterium]
MTRAAAFFDLDKTIIAKSSTLAFGRSFFHNGLINRRAVLASAYAQLVYVIAGADAEQMDRIRDRSVRMVAGWDVRQVREIVAETLDEIVNPLIYAEALELIARHRAAGDEIVIVSTSGADIVEPIGALLGVDRVVATRLVVKDGRYTGEIEFYAYGENKAAAVAEIAAERGWDLARCHAYSDSVTDTPLLELVGHPTAVNPDRALRRIAIERDWPIRTFSRPVPLRRRLRPSPLVAGGAAGTAAVMAGFVWYAGRYRRRRAQVAGGEVFPSS